MGRTFGHTDRREPRRLQRFRTPLATVVVAAVLCARAVPQESPAAVAELLRPDEAVADILMQRQGPYVEEKAKGPRSSVKGMFYFDPDGKGQDYLALFVRSKRPHPSYNWLYEWVQLRVYRREGEKQRCVFETTRGRGAFLWPSGLWDLTDDGRLSLVARTRGTAAGGSVVAVYALQDGEIREVARIFNVKGTCAISDLDGDGRYEIVAEDPNYDAHVYAWNGKAFVQQDRMFPGFFRHVAIRDLSRFLLPKSTAFLDTDLNGRRQLLAYMASAGMDLEVLHVGSYLLERLKSDRDLAATASPSLTMEIEKIVAGSRQRLEMPER